MSWESELKAAAGIAVMKLLKRFLHICIHYQLLASSEALRTAQEHRFRNKKVSGSRKPSAKKLLNIFAWGKAYSVVSWESELKAVSGIAVMMLLERSLHKLRLGWHDDVPCLT